MKKSIKISINNHAPGDNQTISNGFNQTVGKCLSIEELNESIDQRVNHRYGDGKFTK